jgi:uncharacterized protein YuzE
MKHAKHYFKKYPKAEVLYFTTDDLAFTDMQTAMNHALELEDDIIIPITRKEAIAAIRDMGIAGMYTANEQY